MLSLGPSTFNDLTFSLTRPALGLSAKFVVGTTTVSNRYRYPDFDPWPMSNSSTGAFASGSPARVNEFHLSPRNTPVVGVLLAFWGSRGMPPQAPWALSFKRGPLDRRGIFNRSNNLVGSLPWYYRACWHQNLAQIVLVDPFTAYSPQTGGPLTISASGHWIVCAPAASLDYESRLSGFLCGIEP